MNFEAELKENVARVKTILRRYLPAGGRVSENPAGGHELQYALRGGKRLRPLMMLKTYEMYGGKSRVIEPFMAAIEMIHTHSLIHDDLPAMDNDEYRRGRKTTMWYTGRPWGSWRRRPS